ncbi:hypothetical protein GQ600_23802 [Phytophthora cactorum]|nr:hypothetical protein GQ600_23802 [Phytophthora cactorum]
MKRELYCHNHPLTEDIYKSYSGSRRFSSYSCIELLVEAKADTTSVYNYIRENSKHRVTMDVARNLIERLKNRGKFLS